MRYEFNLPDLAEGMVEGEVVQWLVAVGDPVGEEQPVVEVMTDKATVVIPSPKAGRVAELSHDAGDVVEVGAVLFVLDVEGAGDGAAAARAPEPASSPTAKSEDEVRPAEPPGSAGGGAVAVASAGAAANDPPPARVAATVARTPRGAGRALATPATRRIARELGVDIQTVTGTGPAGRVLPEDLRRAAAGGHAPPPAPRAAAAGSPASAPAPIAPRPPDAPGGEEAEERVRIRGLRRAIYETMTRSTSTAAHFTYVEEVDCTNLVTTRERLKAAAAAVDVRLTYLPFIAKASMLALRRFPKMNASVDDAAGEIVLKRHIHLGVAAATDAGLTVPVIRHADRYTLYDLSRAMVDLADKARAGRLSPTEAKGSTFTITSLGKLGGVLATPIINHPEVAILGVHLMAPRAVVRGGEIVARTMMNISLSFDHRVIDGHEGAAFAQAVRAYLEDPELMMMEMI